MAEGVQTVPEQILAQVEWCRRLGSPLYVHLLSRAAEDCEAGGPVCELLEPHAPDRPVVYDRPNVALPLQLMAAVHRLVLEGRAPELARFYLSAGGSLPIESSWEPFRRTLVKQMESLRALVKRPVQTNDPGRSGSLLGGFLLIARHTGLPLRLLEIGSSAGLNLCWDRFRYEWSGGAWGDPASPLRLENVFVEGAPPQTDAAVVERSGCDPRPVDAHSPEGRLTLLACTWPDQLERIRLLEAAIGIARGVSYRVESASAADWLESRLARPVAGTATVVFHSAVWPYLTESERARVTAIIAEAGRAATPDAPLAWLRMEPRMESRMEPESNGLPEVRLRIDPGFDEHVIATTTLHAPAVRWRSV
jgi:hypothetical protein